MPCKIRFRNVCFTAYKVKPVFNPDFMTYLVFQQEECPETHRLHWQGYAEFTKQLSQSLVKELLGDDTHLELRQGTAKQASDYCKKPESRMSPPCEFGDISKPGQRNDLEAVSDAIPDAKSIRDIAMDFPTQYIKFHNGIEKLFRLSHPPVDRSRPKIWYVWGPPKAGKTRWARETFPDAYFYVDCKSTWFDGYNGEDTIVFDEFVGATPIIYMLKLLDYGKLQMPVKGGFVPILATQFVFTSNFSSNDLYSSEKQYEAWLRRINEFQVFHSMGGGIVLPATSEALTSESSTDQDFLCVVNDKCLTVVDSQSVESSVSLPSEKPSAP